LVGVQMKKIGLVCTTIGNGEFLDGYCQEIDRQGLRDDVMIIIIPDLMSPNTLYNVCNDARRKGFNIECPLVSDQEGFLSKLGMFNLVLKNSDHRRNVGYLMALKGGAEVIISIDDDNFLVEGQNFFREHSAVGQFNWLCEYETTSGWYNVCAHLGLPGLYARGFPYSHRNPFGTGTQEWTQEWTHEMTKRYTTVNQGLWQGEPDFDAVTWMVNKGLKVSLPTPTPFFLGENSWAPINSQNTSVSRDAMMAYYFIPMNECGMDRMGDIFQGYFLEACVKAVDQGIRIGTPLVEHRRNSHNHMADAYKEIPGIRILEEMLPWLQEVKLDKGSYEAAYLSLAVALEEWVEEKDAYVQSFKSYFHRVAYCMRKWVAACRQL